MIGSPISVICLLVFCFARVLRKPPTADQTHAPPEVDTPDTDT